MNFENLSFEDIRPRLIAVDTEYMPLKTPYADDDCALARHTGIRRVHCAAFCTSVYSQEKGSDGSYAVWFDDTQKAQGILDEAAKALHIANPIFVNYSYEAEWEAFTRLGVDMKKYAWIDCFLLYRMAINIQGAEGKRYSGRLKLVDAQDLLLGVKRDSAHKKAMQDLCADGNTSGYEDEILQYCLEDVQDLIPLADRLWAKLYNRFTHRDVMRFFLPKCKTKEDRETKWTSFSGQMFGLMESLKAFAAISHRGIPVNPDRVDAVHKGASAMKDQLVREFVEKYPDSWRFESVEDASKTFCKRVPEAIRQGEFSSITEMMSAFDDYLKDSPKKFSKRTLDSIEKQAKFVWEMTKVKGLSGTWHKDEAVCQKYMEAFLKERGLLDTWERTPSGALSMSQDALGEFKLSDHKYEEGFGGDYAKLSAIVTVYNGVAKDGEDSWVHTLDRKSSVLRYRSLRPFAAKTGRCQPQTSEGFVFGWCKNLFGVLEPPEGKMLCEVDFSSEETFITAEVFDDQGYRDIYSSKDMYLWMGMSLGMIPSEDFESMTKAELKAKYGDVRDHLKTYTLALGYGAGTAKLAAKVGLPYNVVADMQEKTKYQVFPKSTAVRKFLSDGIFDKDEDSRVRGFWLQSGWHTMMPHDLDGFSPNSPLNFPIQGSGAAILQALVIELERQGVEAIATVHDAVYFLVPDGDMDAVKNVQKTMENVANDYLGAGSVKMRSEVAGIIRHGDIWTPEGRYDKQAREILTAGGYAC